MTSLSAVGLWAVQWNAAGGTEWPAAPQRSSQYPAAAIRD